MEEKSSQNNPALMTCRFMSHVSSFSRIYCIFFKVCLLRSELWIDRRRRGKESEVRRHVQDREKMCSSSDGVNVRWREMRDKGLTLK